MICQGYIITRSFRLAPHHCELHRCTLGISLSKLLAHQSLGIPCQVNSVYKIVKRHVEGLQRFIGYSWCDIVRLVFNYFLKTFSNSKWPLPTPAKQIICIWCQAAPRLLRCCSSTSRINWQLALHGTKFQPMWGWFSRMCPHSHKIQN